MIYYTYLHASIYKVSAGLRVKYLLLAQ